MFEPILELLGKKYSEKQIKPRHLFYASCFVGLAFFGYAQKTMAEEQKQFLSVPYYKGYYMEPSDGFFPDRCYQEFYTPINEHISVGFKKQIPCPVIRELEKEIEI